MEFLETFEMHHNTKTNSVADSEVTLEEWAEYYTNVSASIDSDEYFHLMMNNSWNLDGQANSYKQFNNSWTNKADDKQAAAHWSPPKKPHYTSEDKPMNGYFRSKKVDDMVIQRTGLTSANNPLASAIQSHYKYQSTAGREAMTL